MENQTTGHDLDRRSALGRQQLKSTLPSLVVVVVRISDNEGTTSFFRKTALPREALKFEGTKQFLKREGIRIRAKRGIFYSSNAVSFKE